MISFLKRKILNKFYSMIGDYHYVDKNAIIGGNTFIGRFTLIGPCEIGRYCSIGTSVLIGPGEHPISRISTSVSLYNDDPYKVLTEKNCLIGNDVWIGSHSIILRGVSIGDGAVIGAGSVVTKDIPPFAVVVGVPAKILRYRFNQISINKIIESKWWEHDIEDAKRKICELEDEIRENG
jgi:acetyltransferase-like isoleucine patch superfamily enzyme